MDRRVFINYRGEDSHSYGALLYTELARRFGEDQVFLDCESIPAGADFVEQLLSRVRSARVLLAVIGPRWLTVTDSIGQRRIDNPDDWIRRELAEALGVGVRVIPVLTEQVKMPAAADLPADIAALSRCQYRRLRHHDPTADLARIITDLTSLDPTLAATACSRDDAPRQLPPPPSLFTGRTTELAILTDAATTTPDAGATVVISAIGGAGGIGKTALALHWAYQHLHRFPDGQLYVNLRGFDPSGHPTPTGEAVRGFLDALSVDPATLPIELDAQVARYRSLVAGKRILIVLDNARDVDHVTPLLPGSPTCTVLVTSRHHLAGLTTLHGARLVDLDFLPESDTHDLLVRHLGDERLAAEPHAVAELLAICAGLPLAAAIVAARAAQHPSFPLTVLAEELRDVSARLDGLNTGDIRSNLRAVLSWSFHALSTKAANLFALLGIVPRSDTSLLAAASLADMPLRQAQVVLQEVENASLIQQHMPGRYRMHDLIRLYATDIVHQYLAENVRERVLDFYRHTAALIGELKVLRKGRALFVRQIDERVGPVLRAACHVLDDDGLPEIRRAVAQWLESLAGKLPESLGIAIHAAFALHQDVRLPFYQERVRWIGQRLNIDDRTARRRIDDAIERLAELAVSSANDIDTANAPTIGWHTDELRISLVLDLDAPEVFEFHRVVADRDRVSELDLAMTFTDVPDLEPSGPNEFSLHVIYGGRLIQTPPESADRLVLALPAPLKRESQHEFALHYRVPKRHMQRHYFCVPKHRCDLFDLRVRFPLEHLPARIWQLADAFQRDVNYSSFSGKILIPDSAGEVHTTFRHLTPGLAYGIGWIP